MNTDPTNLIEEIRVSEKRRDAKLSSLDDQLTRYHGPWYDGSGPTDDERVDVQNHGYEYISAFIPQTVHANPRVQVSTSRPTAQRQVAKGLQAGLNRWILDTNFKETLEELAYDYLFRWCVACISVRPRVDSTEQSDPILMPHVTRISPKDFGWDANSGHPKRAKLMFHKWYIEKDDLLERAKLDQELPEADREGWNIEAIEALVAGKPERGSRSGTDAGYLSDRSEVALYDVWIQDDAVDPKKQELETFNGTVRTISEGQGLTQAKDGKQLLVREPRDYFGPPTGPYRVGGCYLVPDGNEPLSPLVATQHQSDLLNAFINMMVKSANNYTRKGFLSGEDPEEAQRIHEAKHDTITLLNSAPDLRNRLIEVTLGGVDESQFQVAGWLQGILDRVSGLTDAQRGNVTGDGSATEVSIAADAGAARTGHIRGKFVAFGEACLQSVSFFMYHTDQIMFALGEEGLEMLRETNESPIPEGAEAWFFGGTFEPGEGGSWFDLETRIDLYSMVRTSEAALRRKSQVLTDYMAIWVPMMPQAPYINWKAATQLLADAENFPELERIPRWDMLAPSDNLPRPMLASQAGEIGQTAKGFRTEAPTIRGSNTRSSGQELAATIGATAPQPNAKGR